MKKRCLSLYMLLFVSKFLNGQTVASFTAPDTVCINAPVTVTNTSTNASAYYWNFCVANSLTSPVGTNIGGSNLSLPVFSDYAKDGNNYYAFVTNNMPGKLTRLDFGNSLLNTPTYTDFGNLGSVIPDQCEGIQVVKNEGKWYAIIVGGQPVGRIVKVEFGASLSNNAPVATNWGNIGNLAYPTDLHVFQSGSNWYGLTVNSQTNSITRFNFSSSFNNTPTGVNLGALGGMNYPTGIYAVSKGGLWYAFITNAGTGVSNSTDASLTRLDFGTSLLNAPTGTNIGNPGNILSSPRDLTIYQSCNEIFGYVVGNASNKELIRLNFNNLLTAVPSASIIGNTGSLNFPHSVSKLFRVNSDLYAFITNVNSNTVTRLQFAGCNNASIASSALQNPPSIVYNSAGTYNINLTIDEGLSTQAVYCKQVIVVPPPTVVARPDTAICSGSFVALTTTATNATRFSWSPSTGLSDETSPNPVASPAVTTQYVVTATNSGGCSSTDTVVITVKTPQQCALIVVNPGFTVPDTVCVNTPVNINNTSTNATSYYWNFCVANSLSNPVGTNLGANSNFSLPVFSDYAKDGNNYYAFVTNNMPGKLTRLDFGNSLLNTPTYTDFGNLGSVIPDQCEGIQVVKNEGKWYAIIVGGQPVGRIVKVEFGASLSNNAPVATNWGNIGNLAYPTDLHVFQDGANWYGLTLNSQTNSITRFSFTNSFNNIPTGVNLGNFGGMNYPTGIYAISKNGNWYAFITNAGAVASNSTDASLTRLDFGTSLLNLPTGTNLGSLGNALSSPRDLTIYQSCNEIFGYVVSNATSKELVRLTFNNSLTAVPMATVIGNTGSLNFPHSISKLFRDSSNLYTFITNVNSNSITRLKLSGCNNSSISSSTLQNPPAITYNTPGTYNINLTVDDGLPTQGVYCKQVVVISSLHTPVQTKSLCQGDSVQLASSIASGNQWNTGSTAPSIYVKTAGTYWVQASNGGCVNIDSFIVSVTPKPVVNLGKDTSLCTADTLVLNAGNPGASYAWQNGQATQTFTLKNAGLYYVTVTKDGCGGRDSILVSSLPLPAISRSADTAICKGSSTTLSATGGGTYSWLPVTGLSNSTTASTVAKPDTTTKYYVSVTGTNGCKASDSVTVTVKPMPAVNLGKDTSLCTFDSLWLDAGNPGATYLWQNGQTTQRFLVKAGGSYSVSVSRNGCVAKDTVVVDPLLSPAVTLTGNTSICRTASVILNASGASLYKWWPVTGLSDSTGAVINASPSVTTTYYLFATGSNGCTAKDSVMITVTPMPVFSVQASKPVLCIGDTAALTAQGGDTYAWYPAQWVSNPFAGVTTAFPPTTTLFSVVIEDHACNITDTLSVNLPVADKPSVALSKSNDINCFQAQATLFAGGGTGYLWQPSTGLNDPRSKSPVVTVSTTTTYTVLVRTPEGCEVQDSITVYVNRGDDASGFPVPSAFTPNGDGKNDCFSVKHWGAVTEFSLNLYNRWGERVFHADDPSQCWNGIYRGMPQPGDVYVYWIKAKTLCGEIFRKGTFALIR